MGSRPRDLLWALYTSLIIAKEVHPHLIECAGCSASIHQSPLGSAMKNAQTYLESMEDVDG